jgi:MFS family permease
VSQGEPRGGEATGGQARPHRIAGPEDRLAEPEPPVGRRARLALMRRDTDMPVLWLATVIFHLGLGMQQVILGWVVLALTHSEAMVGAVFAVRSAPNLVVGFAAGTLTDRYDRRSLMRLAAFGMAGISFIVAWLAYSEQLTVWHLLLGTGALGVAQALSWIPWVSIAPCKVLP